MKKDDRKNLKVVELRGLASLLYIWNISFKYFVESHVLIHFF